MYITPLWTKVQFVFCRLVSVRPPESGFSIPTIIAGEKGFVKGPPAFCGPLRRRERAVVEPFAANSARLKELGAKSGVSGPIFPLVYMPIKIRTKNPHFFRFGTLLIFPKVLL